MFQHSCKFHAFSVWNLHLHTGFSPAAGALRAGNASGRGSGFFVGARAQNRRIQPLRFQERGSLRKSWGKQGAAEILKEHGRKDCAAQHAYFLLCPPLPWRGHVICCRYGLARPRDSVKKQKERLKTDFQAEFRAALDLKSSAGRWGTLETAIDFGAFGFILYDTRAGRKRPRIKTSKAHCGRQRGGWA